MNQDIAWIVYDGTQTFPTLSPPKNVALLKAQEWGCSCLAKGWEGRGPAVPALPGTGNPGVLLDSLWVLDSTVRMSTRTWSHSFFVHYISWARPFSQNWDNCFYQASRPSHCPTRWHLYFVFLLYVTALIFCVYFSLKMVGGGSLGTWSCGEGLIWTECA